MPDDTSTTADDRTQATRTETGTPAGRGRADTSARWSFRALTESNPFRRQYDAEVALMAKLRSGVSFSTVMSQVRDEAAKRSA